MAQNEVQQEGNEKNEKKEKKEDEEINSIIIQREISLTILPEDIPKESEIFDTTSSHSVVEKELTPLIIENFDKVTELVDNNNEPKQTDEEFIMEILVNNVSSKEFQDNLKESEILGTVVEKEPTIESFDKETELVDNNNSSDSIPKQTDEELIMEILARRSVSSKEFQDKMEKLYEKYNHPFDDSDIVDLETMKVIKDFGFIKTSKPFSFGKNVDLESKKDDSTLEESEEEEEEEGEGEGELYESDDDLYEESSPGESEEDIENETESSSDENDTINEKKKRKLEVELEPKEPVNKTPSRPRSECLGPGLCQKAFCFVCISSSPKSEM